MRGFRHPQSWSPKSHRGDPINFSPTSAYPKSLSSLVTTLLHSPMLPKIARFSLLLLPSLLALSTLLSLTLSPFGKFNLSPLSIVNNVFITLRLISFPTYTLDSPHILPLLDSWDSKDIPRTFPWAGMAAADANVALLRPEGKFLYMRRGEDSCVGFNHFTASLSCRVELARKLQRVLVMDAVFCTPPEHSRGAKQGLVRPIYAYYDMDAVKRRVPFLTLQAFRKAMLDLNATKPTSPSSSSLFSPRSTSPLSSISVMVLPGGQRLSVASAARLSSPAVVIWNQSMEDAAFYTCSNKPDIPESDRQLLWPQVSLRIMSKLIAASINNSDFVAVHIRRGDKIKDPKNWPHLDNDTRPESLLIRLPELIPPGRAIYIATDETTPNFFAPLKQLYQVHMIDDFERFWSPGSEWHITYTSMLGDDITFDDTMRGIVDYGVTFLAAQRVETFNDLTSDYRHGIANCWFGLCL